MSIDTFREKVNLKLFSSKETVLLIFRIQSSLVATLAIGLLIYIVGFPQNDEIRTIEIYFMKFLFGFYILNYLVRFLYTFEPGKFIRSTWLELTLVSLLVIEALSTMLFSAPVVRSLLSVFGYGEYLDVYHYVLQTFLLFFLIIDIAKVSTLLDLVNLKASTLFIFSFIILIGMGAVMLMLPEMTTDGKGADWMTALFTSTSASCVTGLIVVDTATYFTFKGQFVIMVLIQLGGLNIISFATFFASMYSKGVSLKHHNMIQDFFSPGTEFDARAALRQILTVTVLIEGLGALVIYSLWSPEINFGSEREKVFSSVFHSISAFNNAGFSLFTNNLYEAEIRFSYVLHIAFIMLVFLGSLSFSAITDIFSISAMKERMRLKWRKMHLSTQVALYSAVFLSVSGCLVLYVLEKDNTLNDRTVMEGIITTLFQSVVARTAGFNTIDLGALSVSALLFTIFLMFVGGSSGSTAGGIKTSTFTIILLSVYSTIRGKRNLELFGRSISWELLNKAFSVFVFAASYLFFSIFMLTILEPEVALIELAFEATSAFATVGLSTGITADLNYWSKGILIFSMFIGRIGTLTLAFALSKKVASVSYKYPTTHFMVG
jgi:trk system potassium uptake protein TrkH